MKDNCVEFDKKFNADDPRAFYEEQYKKVMLLQLVQQNLRLLLHLLDL